MNLIEIDNLEAYYGDMQALFGVDLDLRPGETMGLVGANGAGKSTLLRSIVGLVKDRRGHIRLAGDDIHTLSAEDIAREGIALVPEGRLLFPSLNVKENLLMGAMNGRKGYWTLERIYELFPILGERRAQPSPSLSGGQQQMVAIGRALMANPELILFDEISLGLAPVIIKSIYEALPEIVSQGMTAMIVEQDISKALSVSSRVYCLQEGRVSLEGRTDAISRDQITAAYFGVDV